MLPWLIVPLCIIWALSQLLPYGWRFEVTSPRVACVAVLLLSLAWYEIVMPRLQEWRTRRSAELRERRRVFALEAAKWRKEATRKCRNCLAPYRDQAPPGGKFMCMMCGHVSRRPVLDTPTHGGSGHHEDGHLWHGEWWGAIRCWDSTLHKGLPAVQWVAAVGRVLGFPLWYILAAVTTWRDEVHRQEEASSLRVGVSREEGHLEKGERARRKAEEKRLARLKQELIDAEEQRQREEVARLVEERRLAREGQAEPVEQKPAPESRGGAVGHESDRTRAKAVERGLTEEAESKQLQDAEFVEKRGRQRISRHRGGTAAVSQLASGRADGINVTKDARYPSAPALPANSEEQKVDEFQRITKGKEAADRKGADRRHPLPATPTSSPFPVQPQSKAEKGPVLVPRESIIRAHGSGKLPFPPTLKAVPVPLGQRGSAGNPGPKPGLVNRATGTPHKSLLPLKKPAVNSSPPGLKPSATPPTKSTTISAWGHPLGAWGSHSWKVLGQGQNPTVPPGSVADGITGPIGGPQDATETNPSDKAAVSKMLAVEDLSQEIKSGFPLSPKHGVPKGDGPSRVTAAVSADVVTPEELFQAPSFQPLLSASLAPPDQQHLPTPSLPNLATPAKPCLNLVVPLVKTPRPLPAQAPHARSPPLSPVVNPSGTTSSASSGIASWVVPSMVKGDVEYSASGTVGTPVGGSGLRTAQDPVVSTLRPNAPPFQPQQLRGGGGNPSVGLPFSVTSVLGPPGGLSSSVSSLHPCTSNPAPISPPNRSLTNSPMSREVGLLPGSSLWMSPQLLPSADGMASGADSWKSSGNSKWEMWEAPQIDVLNLQAAPSLRTESWQLPLPKPKIGSPFRNEAPKKPHRSRSQSPDPSLLPESLSPPSSPGASLPETLFSPCPAAPPSLSLGSAHLALPPHQTSGFSKSLFSWEDEQLGCTDPPSLPLEFVDCITREVMQDPVISADGHSYERASISRWLTGHDTSPMTGEVLPPPPGGQGSSVDKTLRPNHLLRSQIKEYQQRLALESKVPGAQEKPWELKAVSKADPAWGNGSNSVVTVGSYESLFSNASLESLLSFSEQAH